MALDLGAGTGILSLFLANAGAALVYAVEKSSIVEVAQRVIHDNGYDSTIQTIRADSFSLDNLPNNEKVDAVVSEFMG